MCMTCGCSSDDENMHVHAHEHEHRHEHGHSHDHTHEHSHEQTHEHSAESISSICSKAEQSKNLIALEQRILQKNDTLAESNRRWLSSHQITAINILGGPGSGKTSLLESTITASKNNLSISVIEGDQETANDAERIRATACPVVQINTGAGCHLDAQMLSAAFIQLNPAEHSVLFIENVGNLVCPALFDLGESFKVVVLSVTEGEDKPLKYPHMFRAAQIMILNKIDLLPYLRFDVDRCIKNALAINPELKIFQLSATAGIGLNNWLTWLSALHAPSQV